MNKIISPRLRWACRRGMLELDLLLSRFLDEAYPKLSDAEQQQFVELLNENDQELYMWLTGKEMVKNQYLKSIIEKIRYHAQHRH